MSAQTTYVALPFDRCAFGNLNPCEARECSSADEALSVARAFGETHAGALAFSRVIDVQAGTALKGHVLTKVGDLPSLGYLLGG